MSFNDDPHLDVCQNIEAGLKLEYERNPALTDTMCVLALETAKLVVKRGVADGTFSTTGVRSEFEGIVGWCMEIARERVCKSNDLTLKEYLASIGKVTRSVRRHSVEGRRSYYEFVRHYLP